MDIYSIDELLKDNSLPPTPIISDGILLKQSLLLIVGAKKVRKSFLCYNFGVALAEGISFAGFTITEKHKVLIFSGEGGYYPNRDRFKKMCETVNFKEVTNLNISFDSRIKIENDNDYEIIKDKIEEIKPNVVIIDPFVKFHHLDENSSKDMGYILERLRYIIEDYDISIILAHHHGKDQYSGARGSSVILGEYDSCITLTMEGEKSLRQKIDFDLRHTLSLESRILKFNNDTFWFEEDISPIVKLLKEYGAMTRKELVEFCLEEKLYQHQSGSYKAITKEIESGNIFLNNDGKYEVSQKNVL